MFLECAGEIAAIAQGGVEGGLPVAVDQIKQRRDNNDADPEPKITRRLEIGAQPGQTRHATHSENILVCECCPP
jgi:hypothetical protein